jgi:L-ascorbate metabolism protein UlaG (beta-lactamase superfamily)
MKTVRRWLGHACVLLALSAPAVAHHSTANFDSGRTTTVSGVVTYVSFTNPHSFIDMNVTAAEGVKPYKVFATSKVALLRNGWRPDSVKPGDTITIEGRPDRTDPTQLYLLRITFADGSKWSRDEILQ